MDESVFVFVYGTLKRGYGNHGVLGGSEFVGEAVTDRHNYYMFDGGFPWVVDGGEHKVVGELYEVKSKNILDNLDRLEGVPYMYVKSEVDVVTLYGQHYSAYMYIASEASTRRLFELGEPMEPVGRDRLVEWKL